MSQPNATTTTTTTTKRAAAPKHNKRIPPSSPVQVRIFVLALFCSFCPLSHTWQSSPTHVWGEGFQRRRHALHRRNRPSIVHHVHRSPPETELQKKTTEQEQPLSFRTPETLNIPVPPMAQPTISAFDEIERRLSVLEHMGDSGALGVIAGRLAALERKRNQKTDGVQPTTTSTTPWRQPSPPEDAPPTSLLRPRRRRKRKRRKDPFSATIANGQSTTVSSSSDTSQFIPQDAPTKTIDPAEPLPLCGDSLKTWTYASKLVRRVQIVLNTDGRPLDASVEMWEGPENTPYKMRIYVDNGGLCPFTTIVETPKFEKTVAIRNKGLLEFPMSASVQADLIEDRFAAIFEEGLVQREPREIQGGSIRFFAFEHNVESVQVILRTDGRPLNARVELLQGPNNIKQAFHVHTEDGRKRPFFAVVETPGHGNVIRVINTASVEFPLSVWVEPYTFGRGVESVEPIIGGDNSHRQWEGFPERRGNR